MNPDRELHERVARMLYERLVTDGTNHDETPPWPLAVDAKTRHRYLSVAADVMALVEKGMA